MTDASRRRRRARTLPIGISLTRSVVVLGGAGLALAMLVLVAVTVGSAEVSLGDTAAILGRRLLALPIAESWAPSAEKIIFDIRLPRVLTAMLVGGGLAVAGTVFQALLRNPLADPYVIGTAAGAASGPRSASPRRSCCRRSRSGQLLLGLGVVQVLAFVGGIGTVLLVYAARGGAACRWSRCC